MDRGRLKAQKTPEKPFARLKLLQTALYCRHEKSIPLL